MENAKLPRRTRLDEFNPDDPELARKLPKPPRDGLSAAVREQVADDLRNAATIITRIADHAAMMPAGNIVMELGAMVWTLRQIRDRALT